MLSPTTARGLLVHLPQGADPPANNRRATTPTVRSPTSLSLRLISATGAGGKSAWGGASGHRAPREVGRGEEGGEAESEGWSGGSYATSDTETEEEGWGHAPLTASPRGTQERGARGLQAVMRVGGIDDRNITSATADEAEMRGRHGERREQGGKKGGRRGWEGTVTWGKGRNYGGCKASRVDPDTQGVEREEGAARPPEWRKTPGGAATEWRGGVESSPDD